MGIFKVIEIFFKKPIFVSENNINELQLDFQSKNIYIEAMEFTQQAILKK